LQGNWVGDLERTLMRTDLETEDFGELLREMGIYPSMKGGTGTLTGTLSWPGQPQTFQAGDLSGSLRLAMANGEIEELFFLSKALSTLNVLDWPSQAVRGFDSLTHSGLVYRELKGNLILQDGMAGLEDWRLVGAPLRLRARGQMDLGKRTFDLLFRLEPLQTMDKVVSAVPLLGYLLTGEGGSLTALHYRVRGPWEEPEVSAAPDPREELPWETLWRRMREMEWQDLLPGG